MSTAPESESHFFAIIPAGGVGSRLWPLSRAKEPKFLLDLTGSGRSLLQSTWSRLVPLTTPDRIVVATGVAHESAVREQLPDLRTDNLLLESQPRDSTAAIVLAAALVAKRDPDAVVGSFPADHFIGDEREFRRIVTQAVTLAEKDYLVTIGITPTAPSTAFGYIQTGDPIEGAEATGGLQVRSFVEKPKARTAKKYLATGEYLWNAGMFVARAGNFLGWLEQTEPELAAGIAQIVDAWGTDEQSRVAQLTWPLLKKVAIDYSIAEPVAAQGRVAVIPGDFDWDDVGDFSSVARQIRKNNPGNLAILGAAKVLADSSTGVVVSETERLISVIGVKDIVIVDTDDVLLITTAENAQKVKGMVATVKQSGNGHLL